MRYDEDEDDYEPRFGIVPFAVCLMAAISVAYLIWP